MITLYEFVYVHDHHDEELMTMMMMMMIGLLETIAQRFTQW